MPKLTSEPTWVAVDVGWFGDDDADADCCGPLAPDFDQGSYWGLD
jgi:hypothetical protein